MNVSGTIGYRGAVTSTNREASQQRYETVADDSTLYEVRVDVDGIEPLVHDHHGIGLLTERVQAIVGLFCVCFKVTVADGVRPSSGG